MKKNKCLCEQEAGMGNVKSTRLEEIEYKLRHVEDDVYHIHKTYTDIESIKNRIQRLEEKLSFTFIQVIRRRIKEWLDKDNKSL